MLSFVIICSVSRVLPTPRPFGIHFLDIGNQNVSSGRDVDSRVGLKREVE